MCVVTGTVKESATFKRETKGGEKEEGGGRKHGESDRGRRKSERERERERDVGEKSNRDR